MPDFGKQMIRTLREIEKRNPMNPPAEFRKKPDTRKRGFLRLKRKRVRATWLHRG